MRSFSSKSIAGWDIVSMKKSYAPVQHDTYQEGALSGTNVEREPWAFEEIVVVVSRAKI